MDLYIFIYTKRFLFICTSKKTISLKLSSLFFWRYYPFRRFFWKNHSSLTSVIADISYQATYHWKALEQYIPNIYTFMGQKSVIFLISSLIILTILMKTAELTYALTLGKKVFWICIFLYTPNDSFLNGRQKKLFL